MATSVLNSPLRSMIRSSSKRALSSQNRTSNNSICFRQKYSFQQSPFTPHQSKRRTHVHLPRAVPVESLQSFITAALSPSPGLPIGATVNSLVYLFGIKVLSKGLTWEGIISSWFLGTLSYAAFGPGSYFIVCLYFLVGSFVTKLKLEQKQKEGIAEARSGQRGLGSVLGSGFAGIICAILALSTGRIDLWQVGFIASFASKLADTASSEVGKAYGKTTYLITSLKRVPRGTEGAVSLEGTAAGVVAALFIAAVAMALKLVDLKGVWAVVAASVVANLLESVLGASVQGNVKWLTNDVVNVLQISVAAGLAVLIHNSLLL